MTPQQEPEINDEEFEPIPHDEGTAEMKAERLGWVPKDQYRGKQPWVDAEEYLARLEEDSPKLRHALKKLALDNEELKSTNAAILAHHERVREEERKEAYDRATADLEARLEQATAAGDTAGVKALVKRQQALDTQIANPAPPIVPKRTISAEDAELVENFKADNAEWFLIDPEMTKFAQDYETALMKSGIPLAERLQKTLEKVQRRFPQEFTNMNNDALDNEPPAAPAARTPAPRQAAPQRNNSSSVRRPAPAIVPGSYEALTNKGKAECDRHVRAFPEAKRAHAKATWLKFARADSTLFNQ